MRISSLCVIAGFVLGACSVPNKEAPSDGGIDTPGGGDDSGAPDTMLTSSPPDFSNQAQATFEFSSNRSDATFQCRVDGGDTAACTSPKVLYSGTGARRSTSGSRQSAMIPAAVSRSWQRLAAAAGRAKARLS